MRTSTYIPKTIAKNVSDSIIGLALLAAPALYLANPNSLSPKRDIASEIRGDEIKDAPCEGLCGEQPISKTSLGRFLETEVANRMDRISGRTHSKSVRLERAREIASAVAEASYLYDVDPFLLISMIEVESRYNVNARGRHGEIGLMQIKPSTARWVAPVTDSLWDCSLDQIRCNIMMGARYVGHIQHRTEKRKNRLKDEVLGAELTTTASFREHVLRSYNLGPAKANRLAAKQSDRLPAMEGQPLPYAKKISMRADRLRSRYLMSVAIAN